MDASADRPRRSTRWLERGAACAGRALVAAVACVFGGRLRIGTTPPGLVGHILGVLASIGLLG